MSAFTSDDAAWITTNLDRMTEEAADRDRHCCARCARGTRAMRGPCAYSGRCPNHCHEKGYTR